MSAAQNPNATPEPQDDGRTMTILEHLQELRSRLMICAIAMVLSVAVSFYPLSSWVLKALKKPAEDKVPNFELIFTQPLEAWSTYFRVALLLGIAIAMPILLWQLMGFVGPGLTRNEKKWVYPIILGASLAFIGGILFAYFVVMPPALNFFLKPPGGIATPLISVKSYVDFTTRLLFVTGLVFETPLLIMGLAKVGVVTSRRLLRWWRYAVVLAFIVAAVVTPTIDPVTQSLVAGPIVVLYFVGILLAKLVESTPIIPRS